MKFKMRDHFPPIQHIHNLIDLLQIYDSLASSIIENLIKKIHVTKSEHVDRQAKRMGLFLNHRGHNIHHGPLIYTRESAKSAECRKMRCPLAACRNGLI